MTFAAMMLAACLIDSLVGWPDRLFARIGHPVSWIGAIIGWIDAVWNRGTRRRRFWRGALGVLCIVGGVATLAFAVQLSLPEGAWGIALGAVLAWPFVALRAMFKHVEAVADPLDQADLPAARLAVSMIVGRDPAQLDAPAVARAALESLAENTSDGIIAPVFWGCVAGLPGIAAYKAINTLDSMIGHRNARYEEFGKVAARLDDFANLVPARLTGGLFALVSGRAGPVFAAMLREASQHRSPNAGWPEAAMARAIGVRLSGPRNYGDQLVQEPWFNPGAPDPGGVSVRRGLALYIRAMGVMAALLTLLTLI